MRLVGQRLFVWIVILPLIEIERKKVNGMAKLLHFINISNKSEYVVIETDEEPIDTKMEDGHQAPGYKLLTVIDIGPSTMELNTFPTNKPLSE